MNVNKLPELKICHKFFGQTNVIESIKLSKSLLTPLNRKRSENRDYFRVLRYQMGQFGKFYNFLP